MYWYLLTIVASLGQASKDILAKNLSSKISNLELSIGVFFGISIGFF